jgi:hypothetical protein
MISDRYNIRAVRAVPPRRPAASAAAILLASLCLWLGLCAPAFAGRDYSDQARILFFYAENSAGENVLIRAVPVSELDAKLSHSNGAENYHFSYIDRLPTVCYNEGSGFTLPELVRYIGDTASAPNLKDLRLSFAEGASIRFIPTDTNSVYGRWDYETLYSVNRYFYPRLADFAPVIASFATNYGSRDEAYDSQNPKYFTENKNGAFKDTEPAVPALLTRSASGRISAVADRIAANGGRLAGSLKGDLTSGSALHFLLPPSEAEIRSGASTASDNVKWVYGIELAMAEKPAIQASKIEAPQVKVTELAEGRIQVEFTCATPGAVIYHNLLPDGGGGYRYRSDFTVYDPKGDPNTSAQYEYTGPIVLNAKDELGMVFYFRAVREGYGDAGVQRYIYTPGASDPKLTFGLTSQAQGNRVTLTAALTADRDAYTLYGAEYALEFDAAAFEGVSVDRLAPGWRYGLAEANGRIRLTFVFLDAGGAKISGPLDLAGISARRLGQGPASIRAAAAATGPRRQALAGTSAPNLTLDA